MAHIMANGLCAVIHQLFAASGRKMCEYRQLDAKIAVSTDTHESLLWQHYITSFHALHTGKPTAVCISLCSESNRARHLYLHIPVTLCCEVVAECSRLDMT
jgi:hypothetical protein